MFTLFGRHRAPAAHVPLRRVGRGLFTIRGVMVDAYASIRVQRDVLRKDQPCGNVSKVGRLARSWSQTALLETKMWAFGVSWRGVSRQPAGTTTNVWSTCGIAEPQVEQKLRA